MSQQSPFADDDYYDGYEDEYSSDLEKYHEKQMKGAAPTVMDQPGVVKRGSPNNSEIQFKTESLLKFGVFKIISNNATFFKFLFMSVFAISVIYFVLLFFNVDGGASQVVQIITTLVTGLWTLIVAFITLIVNVLFVYPITWIAIWGFFVSRLFYGWVLSREHDVFVVMWMDGYKHLRIVMYPKYIDEAGNPYLGGKASFWYKLFNGGPPRIPFHPEMYAPFMDFMQVTIENVEDGYGSTTLYSGSGVIIYTDPSNDIDDSQEAAEVFQYIDVPSEVEGKVYRYCTIDTDRILPVDIWQSILSGMDLKYWQKYSDERKKNQLLVREYNFTIYDQAMKFHSDLIPTQEDILRRYKGEVMLDPEEYRSWDRIERQMSFHASGN